jgi:hypothetical protein
MNPGKPSEKSFPGVLEAHSGELEALLGVCSMLQDLVPDCTQKYVPDLRSMSQIVGICPSPEGVRPNGRSPP